MSKMEKTKASQPPFHITRKDSDSIDTIDDDDARVEISNDTSSDEESGSSSSDKLSWRTKIAYALPGLPYSMQLSILAFYINYFLLDVAKVSPGYNAAILFTSRFIDALTDPIGGYIFNRVSFRWGKMKPWILFSAPFIAATYFGIWSLLNTSEGGKFTYYIIIHSLYWTFVTGLRIPHTALTVYLTLDQNERDQLTKYRTLCEAAGLLLSIVFHGAITSLFKVPKQLCDTTACLDVVSWTNDSIIETECLSNITVPIDSALTANVSGAYMTSGGIVALLGIITAVFLYFSSREILDVIPTNETTFIESVKMIIKYKPFLILTAATVASILATQSIQSVLELYLNHVKRDHGIFPFLAGALIVSTMILLVAWSIIMRKIGKKKSFFIGNLCLAPAIVIILIPDSPMWLLFLAAVLGANTVACGYIMPWVMLPECMDAFMLETSRKPVETFYTFFFLGSKIIQALYSGIVQLSLGASGFNAKCCEQPPAVSLTLRLLMGAVPGVVLFLSTICLYFYPIDDERSRQIQMELHARRNQLSTETKLISDLSDTNSDEFTKF